MRKANWCLAGLLPVVMAGCSDDAKLPIDYPANQHAFHALNQQCKEAYAAGQNEIQKSLAFNQCNTQRAAFADGEKVSGWVGRLTDISTDQGADVVSVTIESTIGGFDVVYSTVSNRISDFASDSLITPSNPLFNELAKMKEGDWVTFDATLLAHPEGERGIWESSLTEEGSMGEPEFNVRFSNIRPYAAGSVGAVAAQPDPSAQSNNSQTELTLTGASTEAATKAAKSVTSVTSSAELPSSKAQEIEGSESPSFDCSRAESKTEIEICSNATLARVDEYTAEMYHCLLERSPADKEELKAEQRTWLPKRNACQDDVGCIRGAYGEIAEVYMTNQAFAECQGLVAGG